MICISCKKSKKSTAFKYPILKCNQCAFGEHLKDAWEHLRLAEQHYPEGCDVFTISGHIERAKDDCKQAGRLAGCLPNADVSDPRRT